MQNRLVLTGIPPSIPNLPQSANALRDLVERNGCWVDRFAFPLLLLPRPTVDADADADADSDSNVGNRTSEESNATIEAAIELHLENVRDSVVDKMDGMTISLDEVSGVEVHVGLQHASGMSETDVEECASPSTIDGSSRSSMITFQVRASAATAEQSAMLVELCPLEDDPGERIQTLHLPHGIGLTVARSTCGGGTGAEPWRGGMLLAKVLCSWASGTSAGIRNNVIVIDDDEGDDGVHNENMPTFGASFHDRDVMELGAGAAGLPSMALAKLVENENSVRPSSIIATDGVDEIVNVLEGNVARNNLESSIRVQHLDWNHLQPRTQSVVNTIIFSDCVYNEEGADALHNAILHLLRPGGFVLGVLPDFRVGLTDFEAKMKQSGFVPVDAAIKTIEKATMNNTSEIPSSLINRSDSTNGFLCAGGSDMNYRTVLWEDRRDR